MYIPMYTYFEIVNCTYYLYMCWNNDMLYNIIDTFFFVPRKYLGVIPMVVVYGYTHIKNNDTCSTLMCLHSYINILELLTTSKKNQVLYQCACVHVL